MEDVAAGAFTFTVECNGSSLLKLRAWPYSRVSSLVRVLERVLARASDTEPPPSAPSGCRLFFAEHPLFALFEGQLLDTGQRLSDCGIGEGAKLLFMSGQTGVAGEVPPSGPEAHGHEQPPGEVDLAEAMERLTVTERAAAPSAAAAVAARASSASSGGGGASGSSGGGGGCAELPSLAMD